MASRSDKQEMSDSDSDEAHTTSFQDVSKYSIRQIYTFLSNRDRQQFCCVDHKCNEIHRERSDPRHVIEQKEDVPDHLTEEAILEDDELMELITGK